MSETCSVRAKLEEEFQDKCAKHLTAYEACAVRLEESGNPDGQNCEGWYGDYIHCLDTYVTRKLFAQLK